MMSDSFKNWKYWQKKWLRVSSPDFIVPPIMAFPLNSLNTNFTIMVKALKILIGRFLPEPIGYIPSNMKKKPI